jgi:hypothetical protein
MLGVSMGMRGVAASAAARVVACVAAGVSTRPGTLAPPDFSAVAAGLLGSGEGRAACWFSGFAFCCSA